MRGMPTRDRAHALSLPRARDVVRAATFEPKAAATSAGPGRIGLEPERFALEFDAVGRPGARLALEGHSGVLARLARAGDPALGVAHFERHPPWMDLPGGGSVTFEPGAQIEHSTAVYDSASTALDEVLRIGSAVERALGGARLVSLGVDPWHTPQDVPQQLRAPRYHAMERYLEQHSAQGAWMMRNSCSLQVNLDLGGEDVREARYLLANLLSPLLVGIFSTSPELPGEPLRHSRRARIWQELDPSRSGFPADLVAGRGSAVDQYTHAALAAGVLLVRTDGGAEAGRPGWTFADWIEHGHPTHGWPTADDLVYHLSTLFLEVRVRGFHELRGIDALPPCWRAAAVVFTTGLLYDAQALERGLALLSDWRPDLPRRWARAGESGLADADLARAAAQAFDLALAGAERLGGAFLRAEHIGDAAVFAERFTRRGRAPADELRELLGDPRAAAEWALGAGCRRGPVTVGV
jgi:glutamate--cysteine ligase